jgi:uncharacterized repeat protein (TIGR01451 family)
MKRGLLFLTLVVVAGGGIMWWSGVLRGQSDPAERSASRKKLQPLNVEPSAGEPKSSFMKEPPPQENERPARQSETPRAETEEATIRGEILGRDVLSEKTPETPGTWTERQEPAISVEWLGPTAVKVGQAVVCMVVVKNTGMSPVHQVVVLTRLPAGLSVQATEPKAMKKEGENSWSWDLGTLDPQQQKWLQLQVKPESRGDFLCRTQVVLSSSCAAKLQVREPRIVLKVAAPEKVMLGETAALNLTVLNPGDGPAEHVKIKATLPEGLEHPQGRALELELGEIPPGENRSAQLVCTTKTKGLHECLLIATADGNLSARDMAVLDVKPPHLDVVVSGPRLRYMDRHAVYNFKVTNSGTQAIHNVVVSDLIPAGFRPVAASDGGKYDPGTQVVSWVVDQVPPGDKREVSLEIVAIQPGEHRHQISVTGRGVKAETSYAVLVKELSSLQLDVVETEDPIEIEAETTYEVRVSNGGSRSEANVQVICTLPEHLELLNAQATPSCQFRRQGREVIFEPQAKLAPKADLLYKVTVRGTGAGDVPFRARVTADGMASPVQREERTMVYDDRP